MLVPIKEYTSDKEEDSMWIISLVTSLSFHKIGKSHQAGFPNRQNEDGKGESEHSAVCWPTLLL